MEGLAKVLELFGGLVLLLFGWERLGSAFQMAFGHLLGGLGRQVVNPWQGIGRSAIASAFLHSSVITSIMAVGFVTAGLLGLPQVSWILLGSELGSALAVQLLSLPFWKIGPGVMLAGFLLSVLAKQVVLRQMGHLLMGLGLALLGQHLMSQAADDLTRWSPLLRPLVVFGLAALLTSVTQSVMGVICIAMALASQGVLSVASVVPWVLGSLLGTCINAAWSMMDKPPAGKRVGLVHIMMRGTTVGLGFLLLNPLTTFSLWLSSPLAHANQATPHMVANVLLLVAVGMALLFLPLVNLLDKLAIHLIPNPEEEWQGETEQPGQPEPGYQPKYLDETLLESPNLAIAMARREAQELATQLGQMMNRLPDALVRGDLKNMARLRRMDDLVDEIHRTIILYLSRLETHALSVQEMDTLLAVVGAVNDMESIGDIIENNLYHLAEVRVENHVTLSVDEANRLDVLHQVVFQGYRQAVNAFVTDNLELANRVLAMKEDINRLDGEYRLALVMAMRCCDETPNLVALSLQSDMRENLKRIYYHAKRIAKVVVRPMEPDDRMSNDD
ncbi:MAG: Na/Pi cotransporter family protein [Magnetococcales bacterium]|nr:Na/Pi cotransporter family protein [Magnetococcales bacterium]NGZ26753.1 Na/Pi cotransporter family protein [Magnetococcales bacterium]